MRVPNSRDDDVVSARDTGMLAESQAGPAEHRVDRERHERHEEGADPEDGRDDAAGLGAAGRQRPGRAAYGNSGVSSRSKPKAWGPTSSSPASVWSALGESSAITRTRWP